MKIDNDLPIPPKGNYWTKDYDFLSMKVKESFLIQGVPHNKIYCKIYQLRRQFTHKFTIRKVKEGIRVWRIE